MKPMTLGEIANAVGGTLVGGNGETSIHHITTDSRTVGEGSLFVPLRGERFDGHDFILSTFLEGAVCAFSDHEISGASCLILVEDTRLAFGKLAAYYRSLFPIPVVAVTGSVGKTTTKDMIASVLGQKYHVLKTQGNFNNDIGVPITLFGLEETHQVAVVEMGMNNAGEIRYLTQMARPDIVVITNVGVSHIENLGSREGILAAKCEIFEGLKKGGVAILNADDDMLPLAVEKLPPMVRWYGVTQKKDIYAEHIVSKGIDGTACYIHTPRGEFAVEIPVPGAHMVLNAMAAAGVGMELGLTMAEIAEGIETFVPTGMRMAVSQTKGGFTIINDVYNANPVSMKAALDVLAKAQGHKVAILGDMFELGSFAWDMHHEVGTYAKAIGIDRIICIGEASKAMAEGAAGEYYPSQEAFWEKGLAGLAKDDTILVKASRGMHFERTVERLTDI